MLLSFYTCRETLARLDDYLDRELSPIEQKRVARHLKICHHCARQFKFEAGFLEEMREKVSRVQVPEGLLETVLESLPDATAAR